MCITVHVPKGSQAPDLNREISTARNIQDKTTRQNTIVGLRAISKYL